MGSHSLNVLSLCAGIGGLDLGLRLAMPSARTVCYVEREASAISILQARMEEGALDDAPIWSDIRTFDGKPWRGVVDCIIGGYPCQDFSCAGKRAGLSGNRGSIWFEVARIVSEVRPSLCFFENVPNHLILGYKRVRGDLEAGGFRLSSGLFSAEEVGAPHKRLRLFILAVEKSQIGARKLSGVRSGSGAASEPARRSGAVATNELADAGRQRDEPWRDSRDVSIAPGTTEGEAYQRQRDGDSAGDGSDPMGDDVGDATSERCERRGLSRKDVHEEISLRSSRDCIPDWPPGRNDADAWTEIIGRFPGLAPAITETQAQSIFRGVAHGAPDWMDRLFIRQWNDRLRACGNGIVPECAAAAFVQLFAACREYQ